MSDLIMVLYAFIPLLASVAHAPQLRKAVLSTPDELKGVSFFSWGIFTFSCAISLLYGVYYLGDIYFIVLSTVNLLWNIVFISVLLHKRAQLCAVPS